MFDDRGSLHDLQVWASSHSQSMSLLNIDIRHCINSKETEVRSCVL